MRKLLSMSVMFLVVAAGVMLFRSNAQVKYVPKAVLCAVLSNNPCSFVPGYIGPDPLLKKSNGYSGLFGPPPNSVAKDVQTPFDNMAWQMFVGLNWAASATRQPPTMGLTAKGPRAWQKFSKVSALFGNSPVTAKCTNSLALPVFSIGSDGKGHPMPNNEEYFQASTNLPLIDINGNWVIFERRVNDVEARYLLAPNLQSSQTLTTQPGQANFIKNNPNKGASFTPSGPVPLGKTGSIEIKTAWRIIDASAGDDPSRYYTQNVIVAVPGDLVSGGKQVCATVTLGLVGMHIIQRNPLVTPRNGNLLPQWIWATFEHVDNGPMAQFPCNVRNGCGTNASTNWINKATCGSAVPSQSVRYSFYNQNSGPQGTNIGPAPASTSAPNYPWNSKAPYAQGGTTSATARPQVTRCWSIYSTTAELNTQWQNALAKFNTPFRNYMLVGTQWGGAIEPEEGNPLPVDAVPAMLSNLTLETYIQNYTGSDSSLPGPGSCIGCHKGATLAVKPFPSADFSFLPSLADPATARSKIKTAR